MAKNIGVNLRVTGHCSQGDRKYMEDVFSVAYQQTKDGKDLEYAYFGIFDGHGGREAAVFAKEHLMDNIVNSADFWSDNDEDVLKAIKDGFITTHWAMFKELDSWPRTPSGLPSTSGSTASIAFIRHGKLYTGHVGDSGIVLGHQNPDSDAWRARPLTRDHKPESALEIARIQQSGGKVLWKSGVPRVVWNRPRIGHKGPVRRSTQIDEIPFLAVARSLGDLWSYNSALDQFVVSPEPDVSVMPLDVTRHRCLVLGTDGLWNMVSPEKAVSLVQLADNQNQAIAGASNETAWINPSKRLVDTALDSWYMNNLRADNCSAVTVLLDPPGPPKATLLALHKQRNEQDVEQKDEGDSALSSAGEEPIPEETTPARLATCPPAEDEPLKPKPKVRERGRSLPSQSKKSAEREDDALQTRLAEEERQPSHRILRNRTSTWLPETNKCERKSVLSGLRKKVVSMETALESLRKRPRAKSEDRNASDTENEAVPPKRNRRPLAAEPAASPGRILRSTSIQLVRTLRSRNASVVSSDKIAASVRKSRSRSQTWSHAAKRRLRLPK